MLFCNKTNCLEEVDSKPGINSFTRFTSAHKTNVVTVRLLLSGNGVCQLNYIGEYFVRITITAYYLLVTLVAITHP
jgi:hypothetical protein